MSASIEASETTGFDTFTPCYIVPNHFGNLLIFYLGKCTCSLMMAIEAILNGYS